MTVFKRKDRDGQWNYDFWFNKERYRGVCIDPDTGVEAGTKSGAKLIEAAIKRHVRQQAGVKRAQIIAGKYSFAQAIAGHRDTLAGITTEAKANVEIYLRDLEAYFGSTTPVVEITKLDIERYRSHLASQTVKVWLGGKQKPDASRPELWRDTGRLRSARTNNYYLKRLRYVLSGAHEMQDPLTGVSALPFTPKVKLFPESKRVPRPMPDSEFVNRRAEAKPWTRDAMDLARKFGLRRRAKAEGTRRRRATQRARRGRCAELPIEQANVALDPPTPGTTPEGGFDIEHPRSLAGKFRPASEKNYRKSVQGSPRPEGIAGVKT